jgi:hypothetical protein
VGFSRKLLNAANHWAPTAPSTVLWSQLNVTLMYSADAYLKSKIVRNIKNGHYNFSFTITLIGHDYFLRLHKNKN